MTLRACFVASFVAASLLHLARGATIRETVDKIKKELDTLQSDLNARVLAGQPDPVMQKQLNELQSCIKDHLLKMNREVDILGLNSNNAGSPATKTNSASLAARSDNFALPAATSDNSAAAGDNSNILPRRFALAAEAADALALDDDDEML